MSLADIKRALHGEVSEGAIAGSDPVTRDGSGDAGDVWYKRAHAAINKIHSSVKGKRTYFEDLDPSEDADGYSVYAYFVFQPE
jgi:hypothetical protein